MTNTTTSPATAYDGAPDLTTEKDALVALADSLTGDRRTARALRELVLRKAAFLDRAALTLRDSGHAAGLADAAAVELRTHDRAFGGRIGRTPPHAIEFTDGRSRDYVRQEYREWAAGRTVPYDQCNHTDNCPTTECAYGEGYWDRPEDQDPQMRPASDSDTALDELLHTADVAVLEAVQTRLDASARIAATTPDSSVSGEPPIEHGRSNT
ncbi:hypothetical protein AB0D87_38170 [Streptomyces sp. NPDC048342]|uniref:hypothetical protein n=1 Tax=unclassified Streptomyces TaxID=2593676 RepID=UPI003434925A